MERVLIVSSTSKGTEFLTELLRSDAFSSITAVRSGAEARRLLIDDSFDLVVINAPLGDEFGSELALSLAGSSTSGILLVVRAELADQVSAKVEDYGVFVVAKPMNRQLFYQAVKLVTASRRRLLGLRRENSQLQKRIEEIRIIDRAKCALIQYLGMTEAQAHRYIEKQAMDMRMTKGQVAENILKTYEA